MHYKNLVSLSYCAILSGSTYLVSQRCLSAADVGAISEIGCMSMMKYKLSFFLVRNHDDFMGFY